MARIDDPLVSSPPDEVHLADAPLVRVIAQVRFPPVLTIEDRRSVAPFQEAVRDDYPVLRQEQIQNALVGPSGVSSTTAPPVWRFADVAGDWRVSLSLDFLSLETTRYGSRTDFLERLRTLLDALSEHFSPRVVDRLGLRYINRITGDPLSGLGELVHPELLGVLGTPMTARTEHTLTDSVFRLPDASLRARWGSLPPNVSVDPNAIEPLSEPSWILDLDLFTNGSRAFDVDAVITETEGFAERAYAFFRWAVTDTFLEKRGGELS